MNAQKRLAIITDSFSDLILNAMRMHGYDISADVVERAVADYRAAPEYDNAPTHASERAEARRSNLSDAMEINARLTP